MTKKNHEKNLTTMSDDGARNRSIDAITESGCQVNNNGGVYMQSRVTSVEKYLEIVRIFEEKRSLDMNGCVSINQVAIEAKVD